MIQHRHQQLLKPEKTFSQILRNYGKRFTQVRWRYSDGHDGRCTAGVIMSYYGWNGKDDSKAAGKLSLVTNILKQAGIRKEFVIKLNDSGLTFDEIADNLDNNTNNNRV
jgi:hypothetical protein